MTDRKQALADLLEQVEEGVNRYPFSWVNNGYRTGSLFDNRFHVNRAHQGSLDAAKALHKAVLPRHYAQVHMWPMPEMCRVDIGGGHTGRDDNPARAWLIAVIKALIAEEGDT